MKKLLMNSCVALTAATMLIACDKNDNPTPGIKYNPGKITLSAAQQQNVNGNNGFSLRLFNQVASASDKSFVLSPISLTYTLAMLNNGAAGETQREITKGLGFGETTPTAVNALCNKLITEAPKLDKSTRIDIANAVVVNEKYKLLPGFTSTVTKDYGALAVNKDFTSPATLTYINDWCKTKTQGMIPQIIDKVNPKALTYLLNAIYFKGRWLEKFNKNNTRETTFTTEKNVKTKVQMMHQKAGFRYNENAICQTLILPYGNGSYQMVVLLPREGKKITDVLNSLNAEKWTDNIKKCHNTKVNLSLPRFTTTYNQQLNSIVQALGMSLIFNTTKADFSRLSTTPSYVSRILQNAKIEVDEQGTKAAAATVVENGLTAIGPESEVVFKADHPFIYAITEHSTGTIYFMGIYQGN